MSQGEELNVAVTRAARRKGLNSQQTIIVYWLAAALEHARRGGANNEETLAALSEVAMAVSPWPSR